MAGVQLIVTPMSLSFQAPCDNSQKRLVTLLNPSDQNVIYRIHIDNATDYGVFPMRGYVCEGLRSNGTDCNSGAIHPGFTPLLLGCKEYSRIELDPKKTPRQADETLGIRLPPDEFAQIIQKQYQPGG